MAIADVETGAAELAAKPVGRNGSATVVVAATAKALFAALSGLLLTCSIGLVVWATTPSSGAGPVALLRAGVAAFAAGNGMTVTIGRAALTLPPLMITLVAIALLTTVSGRGRVVASDRGQELAATLAASVTYAAAVTCSGVLLGPAGALRADQWWRPALLALVVVGCTTLVRGVGWRRDLLDRLSPWALVALRLGAVGVAAILGGGAIVVAIGLLMSFNDATTVSLLASPGAGGGLGMALLGIAYLPNAVVAGAGYATGVGFSIGGGTYSPFGSTPTELPAVTLLTGVPDHAVASRWLLAVFLVPLLAAVLIGRAAIRRLGRRSDRLFAVCGAAVISGVVLGLVAVVASGGVAGGEWASTGVPPVLFAVVVTAGLAAVGSGVAALGRVATGVGVAQAGEESPSDSQAAEIAGQKRTPADISGYDEVSDDADIGNDEISDDAPDADADADADADVDDHVGDQVAAAVVAESRTAASEADEAEAARVPESEPVVSSDESTANEPSADVSSDGAPSDGAPSDGAAVVDPPEPDRIREEDLVAGDLAETDEDLVGDLSRRAAPRQVG